MKHISYKQSPARPSCRAGRLRAAMLTAVSLFALFGACGPAFGYGQGSDHWLLTEGAAAGTQPHVAVDYLQNSHIVWKDGKTINYAKVSPKGQPLAKSGSSVVSHIAVYTLDTVMMNPRVAVDSDGAAHIAASAGETLFYSRINPDGTFDFTRHVNVMSLSYSTFEYIGADIAVDPKTDLPVIGTLLIRGRDVSIGPSKYKAYKESVTLLRLSAAAQITKTIYLEGSAEGVGYSPGVLGPPRVAVGTDGVIHAVWKARETNSSEHQGAQESASPGKTYNKAKIENYHLGSVFGIGWNSGDWMVHYSNSDKASVHPLATDPDLILRRVPLRINRPGDIQAGTYRPLPSIVVDEDQWAHIVWCGLVAEGEKHTVNRVLYSAVDPEGYGSGYGINHSKMGTVVRRSREISSSRAVVRNSNVGAALGDEALHVVWEDGRDATGGTRLYQGLIVLGTGHPQAAAERAITSLRPSSAANPVIAFRVGKVFDKWVGYAGDTKNPAMDHFDSAEPDTTVNLYDQPIEVTATFKDWPSGKACPSDPPITLPGEGSGVTFQEIAISADDGVGGYSVVWQEPLGSSMDIAFQHNDFWFAAYGLRNTFQAVSGAWSAADRKAALSDANRLSGDVVDQPIVPSNTYRELIKESNLYPVQGMIADGVTPLILRCDLEPGEYYVTVRPSGEVGTGVAADIGQNRLHVYNHTWEEFSRITVGGPQVRIPKPEGGGAVRECIFYIQGFDCSDPSVGWPIDMDSSCPAAQIPFEIRLFRAPKNGEGLNMMTDAPYGTLYFAVARPPVFLLPGFNPTSEDWSPKFLEILEKGLGKEFVIPVTFATDPAEISGIGEYYKNIENFNLPHDDLADKLKESVGHLVGDNYIKSIKVLGGVIDKLNKLNTLSFEKSIYAQSPLLWLQKLASIQLAMKEDDIREKYQWAMTRYDAVGHCQGGVLLRMLCHAESYDGLTSFLQKRNFGRGRFRRVITVGAPHRGSRITSYTSLYKDFIWETMVGGGGGTRGVGEDLESAKRFGKVLYGNALMLYAGWAGYLEPKFDAFDGEIVWINRNVSVHPKAKFHLISSVIDHTTTRATWAFDGIGLRQTTPYGPGRLFFEVFPPEPTGKRYSDGLVDWRSHFGGVDFTDAANKEMLTHVDELAAGTSREYAAHVSPIPVKRLLLIYQGLKGSTDTSGPPTLTNVIGLTSECLSGGLSGTVQKLALELLKMLSSATGASISPFGTDNSQVDNTVVATHIRSLLDGTVSGPGGPRFGRFHNYNPDSVASGNGNPEGDMSLQDQKADVKHFVGEGVAFVFESVENFVRATVPFAGLSREETTAADNEYWFELDDVPGYPVGSDVRWSATLVNGLLATSEGVELTVDPQNARRVRVLVADWACGYLMLQVSYYDPAGKLVMFEPFQAATIGMTEISGLHFLQSEIAMEKNSDFVLLLEAQFEDAHWGPFLPDEGDMTWASSDETVVTVDAAGVAHSHARAGTVTVTATYGDVSATVDITVEGQGPTVVLRSPVTEVQMMAGEDLVMEAQANDVDGAVDRLFFFANLETVGEGTPTRDGYTFTWQNVPAGEYSIFAFAVDDEGLADRSNATAVVVQQRPPTLDSWNEPQADAWYSGCVYFHATASDPDGDEVTVTFEYSLNSTDGTNGTWAQCWYPIGAPPYDFSWPSIPADAVDDEVWLRAYAVDSNGAESAYETRRIRVDNSTGPVVFDPHPGQEDVPLDVHPTLTFEKGVTKADGSPVTQNDLGDIVRLQKGLIDIPVTLSINAGATVITVVPAAILDGVSAYTVSLGAGLADGETGDPILPASSTFTTTYGSPAAIAFFSVPGQVTAGSVSPTPFQVAVLDDQGNVVLDSTAEITIGLANRVDGLAGTLSAAAVEGVAEFNDLSMTEAGVFELSASSPGFSDAVPASFRVSPGPLGHFTVSGLAAETAAGAPVPLTVTAFDVYGNVKTDYEGTPSFASSDADASMPGPYTFYLTDEGVHTYARGIVFHTLGEQWVKAFQVQVESAPAAILVVNAPPSPPQPASPVEGAYTGLRPVLSCEAFEDADNAGHAATQWQVAADDSFADIVWDSGVGAADTSVQVPEGELQAWTPFFWRARFEDASGDAATEWSDWSEAASFHTAHQFPFADDFSVDRGWQGLSAGRWERRSALAGGGENGFPDPGEDASPSGDNMLLGYAVGADYPAFMTAQSVISPPVDCSNAQVVEFSFMRWLGVESDDWAQASVGVSVDGVTWNEVWSNPATETADAEWTPVTFDITPFAAGKSTVYIRFVMGPHIQALPYCGWNIDDIELVSGQADMAQIILECPETGLQVGQLFHVNVYVQENVDEAAGFLGGTVDVDYPATMLNYDGSFRLDWIVQSPFTFLRSGSHSAGKIRDLGGLTPTFGHGDGEPVLLAVFPFRATQAGTAQFTAVAAAGGFALGSPVGQIGNWRVQAAEPLLVPIAPFVADPLAHVSVEGPTEDVAQGNTFDVNIYVREVSNEANGFLGGPLDLNYDPERISCPDFDPAVAIQPPFRDVGIMSGALAERRIDELGGATLTKGHGNNTKVLYARVSFQADVLGATQVFASPGSSGLALASPVGQLDFARINYGMPLTVTIAPGYRLHVNNGVDTTGKYNHTVGRIVTIAADAPATGTAFDRWEGDVQHLAAVDQATTTVTMPAAEITVTAVYRQIDYTLTVNNGSGDSTVAHYQDEIEISADQPAIGQQFDRWTGATQYLADPTSSTTTVTMPAANVTVTATYKNILYTLVVNNGTGDTAQATYGQWISVAADAPGESRRFYRWTGDTGAVQNMNAANTWVIMPANNVTITAEYKNLYHLTVVNGTGTGKYAEGDNIVINADDPGEGPPFTQWIGNVGTVADVSQDTTSLVMPSADIALIAVYGTGGVGEVTIALPKGWSLISVHKPTLCPAGHPDYADLIQGPMWVWNGRAYVPVSYQARNTVLLEPDRGYWTYSLDGGTLTLP